MLKNLIKRSHQAKDKLLTPLLLEYFANNELFQFDEKTVKLAVRILRQETNEARRNDVFHPSGSHNCMRMQTLSYMGYPAKRDDEDIQQYLIFDDGKWRHFRWHLFLYRMGISHRVEKYIGGIIKRVGGTPDQILKLHKQYPWLSGKRVGFEMKGINSGEYGILVRRKRPKPAHIFQVVTYMILEKLDLYAIIYENKDKQEFIEFDVTFDKSYREHLEEVIVLNPLWRKYLIARYNYMNLAVDRKSLPAIECTMHKDDRLFRRCPQAENCTKLLKEKHATLKPFPEQENIEEKLLSSLHITETEGRWFKVFTAE